MEATTSPVTMEQEHTPTWQVPIQGLQQALMVNNEVAGRRQSRNIYQAAIVSIREF